MKKQKIYELLLDSDCDALLITSKQNRFWLTGFMCSSGYLLITREKNILILDGRYKTDVVGKTKNCELLIIKKDIFDELQNLVRKYKIKDLGFESEYMTYNFIEMFKSNLKLNMKPINMSKIRFVKDDEEIAKLEKAAEIGDNALKEVIKQIKVGMTEDDIENILFKSFTDQGADKIFPRAVVTSGVRGALPHGKPTNKKINKNEFITIDFGCVYQGYCSDMTRTILLGEVEPRLKNIYEIVKEAQALGIAAIKPGVKCSDIHKICFDYIDSKGYGDFFVHQTGHSIGIEVHEAPRVASYSKDIFEPGMVVTVEPGIYVPELGGVRIEDMILVTKDGNRSLTKLNKDLVNILV